MLFILSTGEIIHFLHSFLLSHRFFTSWHDILHKIQSQDFLYLLRDPYWTSQAFCWVLPFFTIHVCFMVICTIFYWHVYHTSILSLYKLYMYCVVIIIIVTIIQSNVIVNTKIVFIYILLKNEIKAELYRVERTMVYITCISPFLNRLCFLTSWTNYLFFP